MPGVLKDCRQFRPPNPWFLGALLSASALSARPVSAAGCASNATLSACFDANSLWLPAGKASFISLPDTPVTGVGQMSFGVASEWLHRPVVLHVDSPDTGGRDVHVVDSALDASFFLAFGVAKDLELNLAAPLRLYQVGAGAGGLDSQSAPALERNAVLNPRVGLGYSLDDALALSGFGLRLALDASLPLANAQEFAGERSVVAMPSASASLSVGLLRVQASVGVRLRRGLDFGGIHLGTQGFAAFGIGLELLDRGQLFVGLEAFALPPLSHSRATLSDSVATTETFLPAEWLASVHSCFEKHGSWSLGVAAGTGIPLSSETRDSPEGPTTSHFVGVTAPDFRSLLVLRFAPPELSRASTP